MVGNLENKRTSICDLVYVTRLAYTVKQIQTLWNSYFTPKLEEAVTWLLPYSILFYSNSSILFTYSYTAPLAVKTNQRRPPVR